MLLNEHATNLHIPLENSKPSSNYFFWYEKKNTISLHRKSLPKPKFLSWKKIFLFVKKNIFFH